MNSTDPAPSMDTLKKYAQDLLPIFLDIRLSLTVLLDVLFEKIPGLKEEYQRRCKDAKRLATESTQPASVATVLQSIDQLSQSLHELYEARRNP